MKHNQDRIRKNQDLLKNNQGLMINNQGHIVDNQGVIMDTMDDMKVNQEQMAGGIKTILSGISDLDNDLININNEVNDVQLNQLYMMNNQGFILDNQGKMMDNQGLIISNQLLMTYNQRLMQVNQETSQNNQRLMLRKIYQINERIISGFQITSEENKKIIRGQIHMTILQQFAIEGIKGLSKDLEGIESEIRLNQFISEYSDATNQLKNVFNKFEQIPKGPFGTLKDSIQRKWFIDAALHHSTGLLASTDGIFDMLRGNGVWQGGKSMFEVIPEFGCQEQTFNYFMKSIEKGIIFFRMAMILKQESVDIYEKSWMDKKAKSYESYVQYCGCPSGFKLERSGKVSEMLGKINHNAKNDFTTNLKKINELENDSHYRKKLQSLLEVKNFDITQTSVTFADSYWFEDVQIVKLLHQSNQSSYLDIFDEMEKCINPLMNSGVNLAKHPACSEQGMCQVSRPSILIADSYRHVSNTI